jgi:hypothetical protein
MKHGRELCCFSWGICYDFYPRVHAVYRRVYILLCCCWGLVGMEPLIKLGTISARQTCPADLPDRLARQTCPADLPGRLARQTCPADLFGSLDRQTCPVDLPGRLARQTCPADLPGRLARQCIGKCSLAMTG